MMASLNFYYFFLFSKDVRLPVQLQRAMAAEAEAAREARAKVRESLEIFSPNFFYIQVIAAEGEQKASRFVICRYLELVCQYVI